jgi:hypothetical protein
VTSTTWRSCAPERAGGTWIAAGLLVLGGAATVAATIVGNGSILVAVAPMLLAVALGVVWFAPMRIPLLMLAFLSLALDATNEGPWNSPVAPIGSLLAANLNQSIPIDALSVPGLVLILGYLLVIHLHRRVRGLRTDSARRAPAAAVSLQALGISLLTVIAFCAWGLKRGGDLSMAKNQVQTFVLVLLVAYLFAISLRSRDYRLLGGLIVAAACSKALYALYVVYTVPPPFDAPNGHLAFATTHGDSMLFACATVMLIVKFSEQPVRRNMWVCLALLPILVAGMVANNRRLVWAEVAAGVLTYWLISRHSQVKRFVVRTLLASIPLILVYVAVGWNSEAKVFAPLKTFRSMGDGEVDASTLYRDLENYNLLATMRFNLVTGTGFGHPFAEPVTLPSISQVFKEYRYLPHNSVLGLWAFCGPVGFTGLWMALVVNVFLAARSYRCARLPDERVAAFMTIGTVVIFGIHCWGDIGFSERTGIFLVGPALAVAGQLAISTGAWRAGATRRMSSPAVLRPVVSVASATSQRTQGKSMETHEVRL